LRNIMIICPSATEFIHRCNNESPAEYNNW
jgi:hypothetical protein